MTDTEKAKFNMLRAALRGLVENIDSGVSAEIFKLSEKQEPSMSSLRYAREALTETQ